MGLFGKKRKDFVDFTEKKNVEISRGSEMSNESESNQESSSGMFGIFGGADVSSTANSNYTDFSNSGQSDSGSSYEVEERKRRLAKRLSDMTEKIEDLSNQIYKFQQRIEVLERKSGVGGY